MISWLSVHSDKFQAAIKSTPALLLYQGQFQEHSLRKERVTKEEVKAAIRNSGVGAVEDIEAVVLETDGSFSVIKKLNGKSASALVDVKGYPV
ncbi:MAG: YetF domain-containing protein [Spirulinaceae cyanobacterium]